ncbi:MAG: aminotransferase class V-fold PLP-dependent enzyme, partial [Bacteroidetes bacterium]|nr:aminotransferase class V-fold PLP-dependent enzyme [Bacteroidota bacterium]
MLSKIKELEEIALQLEPEAEARQVIRDIVIDYSENFLSELAQANTYVDKESNPEAIIQSAFSEEGRDMADLVEMVRLHVDTPGINPASGGHLGYIPGGGLFPSSLADYLAAVTNRYAGIFYANPGAVRMENMIIQWLNELMGYPKTAAGNLASGGSIATLIAITTARDAHLPHSSQFESAVIYLSGQAHHCLHKALRIAGLGQANLREVPLDDHFRMIPSELESMIKQDKAKGLSPFMIIASAGTTDVGAIDPLDQLADLSAQYQLWFHIDAAYGGFFMLCPELRPLFKGMERSDSLVIDPHKGLFLPYGIGVVLVRDADKM